MCFWQLFYCKNYLIISCQEYGEQVFVAEAIHKANEVQDFYVSVGTVHGVGVGGAGAQQVVARPDGDGADELRRLRLIPVSHPVPATLQYVELAGNIRLMNILGGMRGLITDCGSNYVYRARLRDDWPNHGFNDVPLSFI